MPEPEPELGPEPSELTDPVDVVAWLRALPDDTVLLDQDDNAWQRVALDHRYFMCVDGNYCMRVDDDQALAMMAEFGPFRVLWTPPGGDGS